MPEREEDLQQHDNQLVEVAEVLATVRHPDNHVAAAEEAVHHSGNNLAAKNVERPLCFALRDGEVQQRIQRDKEDDRQRYANDDKRGEENAESGGLDFAGFLQLSTVVVDRHLHVGEGLQAVIEGGEVSDSCAQGQPLAIEAHTIGMEESRRQQQLSKHCDQLPGILGGEQFPDAA